MTSGDGPGFDPEQFGIGRFFKYVRDGIVLADAATEEVVLWNDCAGEMFGYSEAEARQLPLHALVPPVLRDAHRSGIAHFQSSGTGNLIDSGHPVEVVGLHKDGTEIPIELTLTKIAETNSDGHRFAMAIIRDLRDRKEAEEARARAREDQLRRRQALQLNDTIVQGLAVAKMALEVGRLEEGLTAITDTLKKAQTTVANALHEIEERQGEIKPGDLVVEDLDPKPPAP